MLKVKRIDNNFIVSFTGVKHFDDTISKPAIKQLFQFVMTPNQNLFLDFEGIITVDESGLDVLYNMQKYAAARNNKIVLINVPKDVVLLFKKKKLDMYLDINPSEISEVVSG